MNEQLNVDRLGVFNPTEPLEDVNPAVLEFNIEALRKHYEDTVAGIGAVGLRAAELQPENDSDLAA